MTIIDSQVHAYEENTPKQPWHSVRLDDARRLPDNGRPSASGVPVIGVAAVH